MLMSWASNLSDGSSVVVMLSSQAHLTPVSTLSGRAPARIRPVIRRRAGGGRRLHVPVSCCLSATGIRFWVILCPLRSWPFLTVGLPATCCIAAGPQRGCHVPHIRDATGVGAPYTPTTAVFLRSEYHLPTAACRLPTARLLPPHWTIPSVRLSLTRHQTGVHTIRPSGLPLACSPRDGTGPLGLNPELRTPPLPATHVRKGTGHGTLARSYTFDMSSTIPGSQVAERA
jgi:hypothetical protein